MPLDNPIQTKEDLAGHIKRARDLLNRFVQADHGSEERRDLRVELDAERELVVAYWRDSPLGDLLRRGSNVALSDALDYAAGASPEAREKVAHVAELLSDFRDELVALMGERLFVRQVGQSTDQFPLHNLSMGYLQACDDSIEIRMMALTSGFNTQMKRAGVQGLDNFGGLDGLGFDGTTGPSGL